MAKKIIVSSLINQLMESASGMNRLQITTSSALRVRIIGLLSIFAVLLTQPAPAQEQIKLDELNNAFKHARTDTARISALCMLSTFYNRSDFLKALEYSQQALSLSRETKNDLWTVRALNYTGNNFMYLGNYEAALENQLEGYKLASERDFKLEVLQCLNSIGVVYDRMERFDEALEYYFKALNLYNENISDSAFIKSSMASLYNNIGNIYQTKTDSISAIEYYTQGLHLSEERNDLLNLGVIAGNLGKIHLEMKHYPIALAYFRQSLGVRQKIQDKPGLAKTYNLLARYYQSLELYDSALIYAQDAYELAEQVKVMQTRMNSAMILYQVSNSIKDYQNAFNYHLLYGELSDSLINERNIRQITQMQLKFEYDRQQKELAIKEKKARIILFLSILILLAGLLISVLIIILLRTHGKRVRLEKEKLELDIDLKNKELATNVMYLVKKNELIDGITRKLFLLKEKLREENREPLQDIILELQNVMDKEVWEEFELRFQQVHKSFYENLQTRFPDLSPAEIKLAAFLRLNMTSKDIASITGQTVKSLEVARARLRKKLGISNQDINLVNFLLEI